MDKIFIILLLILVSCGKLNNGQTTKLVVKVGPQSAFSKGTAQLMLYGVHGEKTFAKPIVVSSSTPETTIELDQGVWDFYIAYWASGSISTNNFKCAAVTSTTLNQAEQILVLTATTEACRSSRTITPLPYVVGLDTAPVKFYSCQNDGRTPDCDHQTHAYRVLLQGTDTVTQAPIAGMNSDCIVIGQDTVKLPFGINALSPFYTVVRTYVDTACSDYFKSYSFPHGLLGSEVPGTQVVPPNPEVPTATVYLSE